MPAKPKSGRSSSRPPASGRSDRSIPYVSSNRSINRRLAARSVTRRTGERTPSQVDRAYPHPPRSYSTDVLSRVRYNLFRIRAERTQSGLICLSRYAFPRSPIVTSRALRSDRWEKFSPAKYRRSTGRERVEIQKSPLQSGAKTRTARSGPNRRINRDETDRNTGRPHHFDSSCLRTRKSPAAVPAPGAIQRISFRQYGD